MGQEGEGPRKGWVRRGEAEKERGYEGKGVKGAYFSVSPTYGLQYERRLKIKLFHPNFTFL